MESEASATLFTSFYPPHNISAYGLEGSTEALLGYSVELLRGRSIKIFTGPKTDMAKLIAAIKTTALNTPITADMDLYDISGTCQRVTLTFAPCIVEANPVACKICIQRTGGRHLIEQKQVMDTESTKPRVADTMPSPYARKIFTEDLAKVPAATAAQLESMRPIIWRRTQK